MATGGATPRRIGGGVLSWRRRAPRAGAAAADDPVTDTAVRILYVSHSFPPPDRPLANVGGMQRVATELHAALATHPEVRLSSLVLRASWRWTHVRVLPFGLGLLRRIPRTIDERGIDAVLFSSMVTAAAAVPLRRALARRGVVAAAIPVGRDVTLPVAPYQRFVPRVFRALDAVFPISRATAEECLRRGAQPGQIRVIPCGVDPARFATSLTRDEARRLLQAAGGAPPLPDDVLLLFSVGRHVERKGFAWFVERVMPQLPANVHFWLAGEGPSTPAIRAAVARRGLEGRVQLLGRMSDERLALLYRAADLFVMPNVPVPGDIEGFGVVMLEAGMSGLPILASRLEGIQDVIREGENGHLLPSGDADAFARQILAYAADRPALAAAAARAARHTRETFTWPAIAERYVQALRALVQRPAGVRAG